MTVAAIIFDMDGLMLDTEPLYKSAWQQAARELGYALDDERYAKLVGRPNPDCERILVDELGASFPLDAFRDRWPALWRSEVGRCGMRTKAGLLELLAYVEEQQLPTAVATSSDADYAAFSLRLAGLAGRFLTIVSGEQVACGKPAPDIYLEAARRLAVRPADCVALEDSEAGIRAIQAAGMIGLLIPDWPASPEAARAAFRVVDNLFEAREVLATLIAQSRAAR